MNQLNQKQLEQHVTILGWLHIASNILLLLIGGFVFFLLTSIGAVSREPEALAVLTIVGTFVASLMAVLALPGILAGYGLLKRRSWGRVLAIIVGVLGLMNFPFGTIVGIYTLWVLLQSDAPDYFMTARLA